MRFRWLSAAGGAVVLLAAACGTPSMSGISTSPSPRGLPMLSAAELAYVDVIRAYWSDLHAADAAADGSDVDAKACLGSVSPTSGSDVRVVEPQICRAYAVATVAAQEKFLAKLDVTQAPAKFTVDDRVFRTQLPKAIADLKAIAAACDRGNRQAIIDAMKAYIADMIPDVTNALDDVDPSVTHIRPN